MIVSINSFDPRISYHIAHEVHEWFRQINNYTLGIYAPHEIISAGFYKGLLKENVPDPELKFYAELIAEYSALVDMFKGARNWAICADSSAVWEAKSLVIAKMANLNPKKKKEFMLIIRPHLVKLQQLRAQQTRIYIHPCMAVRNQILDNSDVLHCPNPKLFLRKDFNNFLINNCDHHVNQSLPLDQYGEVIGNKIFALKDRL